MFNQNGNLNISVSFLLLENNAEGACVKPTLNRYLVPRDVGLLYNVGPGTSLCNLGTN